MVGLARAHHRGRSPFGLTFACCGNDITNRCIVEYSFVAIVINVTISFTDSKNAQSLVMASRPDESPRRASGRIIAMRSGKPSQENSARSCGRTGRRRRSCRLSCRRRGQTHDRKTSHLAAESCRKYYARAKEESNSLTGSICAFVRSLALQLSCRLACGDHFQHLVVTCIFEIPGLSRARFLLLSALKQFNVFFGNDRNAFFGE